MKDFARIFEVKRRIVERFGGQWRLAQHLDVHASTVSAVLSGRRRLRDDERLRWAEAIGIEPAELDKLAR